jgi:hypothetical protein
MSTNNTPASPAKTIAWIVFGLLCLAGLAAGNGSSGSSKPTSGPGSAHCESLGERKFTSFKDEAWKQYVNDCAPADVKK